MSYDVGIIGVSEQVHEFGDGHLYGAVVARGDAGAVQHETAGVARHLYGTCGTLGDVDDDDAAGGGFVEDVDEPWQLRCVAAAVGPHDDGSEAWRGQEVSHRVFLDAGEEGEDDDGGVHGVVGRHGTCVVGPQDDVVVVDDGDAGVGQVGAVEAVEGVETLAVGLGGTVAAQELAAEVDANLRHAWMSVGTLGGCYLDAGDEVLASVGAQLMDGQL